MSRDIHGLQLVCSNNDTVNIVTSPVVVGPTGQTPEGGDEVTNAYSRGSTTYP